VRVKDVGVQHNTRDVTLLGGPRMMIKAGPSTISMTIEFEASDPKTMEKMAKLMGEHQNGGPDIMMELSLIRADGFKPHTDFPDIVPVPPTEFDYSLAPRPATPKAAPDADIPTTPPPEGTW
jgi:hypothetical protein